jgi:N utilization substance protein B
VKPPAPGRRSIRRTAVFLLFQWDLTGRPLGELYEGEAPPEALDAARSVIEQAPELDRRITEAARDWTADRLGTVERNVLRLALVEIDGEDVPDEVAVNEAVELAKRYASEDAAKLVNGILGRVLREKQEEVA